MAHHLAFVAQANAMLLNSKVMTVRIVLAGVRVTKLPVTLSVDANVMALANDAEAAAWRKETNAHLVGLRAIASGSAARSPNRENEFVPENGFFVYEDPLALESLTAAHELWHTFGADHNLSKRYIAPGDFLFNCAHRDPQNRFGTVMSTEPGPGNVYPPRWPVLSADGGLWRKLSTGNAEANNALMVRMGARCIRERYALQH